MTDYPPTHLLRVHVPDPTPGEDGQVRTIHSNGGRFWAPAAALTPIPPEDLPVEVRFPKGSVWRLPSGTEVEITDTRQDYAERIGVWRTSPQGGTEHGCIHPDTLASAERVR